MFAVHVCAEGRAAVRIIEFAQQLRFDVADIPESHILTKLVAQSL